MEGVRLLTDVLTHGHDAVEVYVQHLFLGFMNESIPVGWPLILTMLRLPIEWQIMISKDALESPEGSKLGKFLKNNISRDQVVLTSPAVISRACFTTTPQGCIGLVKRPKEDHLPFPTKANHRHHLLSSFFTLLCVVY